MINQQQVSDRDEDVVLVAENDDDDDCDGSGDHHLHAPTLKNSFILFSLFSSSHLG